MKRALCAIGAFIVAVLPASPALCWGFLGDRTVGAIADQIIARDHPDLKDQLNDILDGRTLAQVATFPDCAIVSDVCGLGNFFNSYKKRNPRHDKYHSTDVPLQQKRYRSNTGGTHSDDVVQILRYATDVLRGKSDNVPANLRQHEAIWIIAHMVGDIHQPLHVGAIYFEKTCTTVVDPNKVAPDEDNFGIGLTVVESHGGGWLKIPGGRQLHKLWDAEAVEAAMTMVGVTNGSVDDFARELIKSPPTDWETPGDVATWSRRWANEILPLAREAANWCQS